MTKSKKVKEPKSLQMSFRVTETFRDVLQAAADREHRSQANMLECIVREYYLRTFNEKPAVSGKPPKKKAAKKR